MKMSKSRTPMPISKRHMLAIASQAMRQVLVDHARRKNTQKRSPGDGVRLTLTNIDSDDSQWDVLELNDAMDRLAELQPRQAEIVKLRFFGGMSVEQVAEVLDVSERTVYLDWQMAKAWLWAELRQDKE